MFVYLYLSLFKTLAQRGLKQALTDNSFHILPKSNSYNVRGTHLQSEMSVYGVKIFCPWNWLVSFTMMLLAMKTGVKFLNSNWSVKVYETKQTLWLHRQNLQIQMCQWLLVCQTTRQVCTVPQRCSTSKTRRSQK